MIDVKSLYFFTFYALPPTPDTRPPSPNARSHTQTPFRFSNSKFRIPNSEFTSPLTFHIDRIRDPHPKFGWWWMPNAWQARWKRNRAKKFLIQALHYVE